LGLGFFYFIVMKSFTDLEAWKIGLHLVRDIYVITKKFPQEEKFALTSQIRRSSTSILANMAEGFSRISPPDKSHKYTIARGECSETLAFLLISKELGYLSESETIDLTQKTENVGKMLTGLIHSHTSKSPTP
jgi:four helix bundle protein